MNNYREISADKMIFNENFSFHGGEFYTKEFGLNCPKIIRLVCVNVHRMLCLPPFVLSAICIEPIWPCAGNASFSCFVFWGNLLKNLNEIRRLSSPLIINDLFDEISLKRKYSNERSFSKKRVWNKSFCISFSRWLTRRKDDSFGS